MLKVLLLEDEKNIRLFLKQILKEIPGISEVYDTSCGDKAIEWAEENCPELIILDVDLGNDVPNGLEIAKTIYAFHENAYIIFVTAHTQYAVDSFEVHPYSYILKPIPVHKFKKLVAEIVQKVQDQSKVSSDTLTLKYKDEIMHLNKKDIIFIEVQTHQTIIHTHGGLWETGKSLNQIELILGSDFLRVHRSYIVNIRKIKKIREVVNRSYEIEFWDYPKIALMSRYHYPKYKSKFNQKL